MTFLYIGLGWLALAIVVGPLVGKFIAAGMGTLRHQKRGPFRHVTHDWMR